MMHIFVLAIFCVHFNWEWAPHWNPLTLKQCTMHLSQDSVRLCHSHWYFVDPLFVLLWTNSLCCAGFGPFMMIFHRLVHFPNKHLYVDAVAPVQLISFYFFFFFRFSPFTTIHRTISGRIMCLANRRRKKERNTKIIAQSTKTPKAARLYFVGLGFGTQQMQNGFVFGVLVLVNFLIFGGKCKKCWEFIHRNCTEAEEQTKENNEQNILATDEMAWINRGDGKNTELRTFYVGHKFLACTLFRWKCSLDYKLHISIGFCAWIFLSIHTNTSEL